MLTLTQLLGFNSNYLDRLDEADRIWLLRSNALVFSGLALMALSVGLIYWQLSSKTYSDYWIGACVIFISLILLIKAHVLIVLHSGPALNLKQDELTAWRPSLVRIYFFIGIAILTAQPYLLLLQQNRLDSEVIDYLQFKATVQMEGRIKGAATSRLQDLLDQKNQISEEWTRASMAINLDVDKIKKDNKNNRKALLIGTSEYSNSLPMLPWVERDIKSLAQNLTSVGYQVTTSLNESFIDQLARIEEYSRTLKNGDTSILFFSGYFHQSEGHNFYLSKDVDLSAINRVNVTRSQSRIIGLTPYIDDLTNTRLHLHTIIVNPCNYDMGDAVGGSLAPMKSKTNQPVLLMSASSPGLQISDCSDYKNAKNSNFTLALLKNLGHASPVFEIIDKISSDLRISSTTAEYKNNIPWFFLGRDVAEKRFIDDILPGLKPETKPSLKMASISPLCYEAFNVNPQMNSYLNCTKEHIRSLELQIDFLHNQLDRSYSNQDDQLLEIIDRSSIFAERLRFMWSQYIFNFILMVFLVFIMTAGIFMRELWHISPLQSYEFIRSFDLRRIIKDMHLQSQLAIDNSLAALRRETKLPAYAHWNSQSDFYQSHSDVDLSSSEPSTNDTQSSKDFWSWIERDKSFSRKNS